MTDTLETDLKAQIAKLQSDLDGAKAQQELAQLKAALPAHWAGARVWVVVIAIAAAAYFLRSDVPNMVNALIPAAKSVICVFLISQALVEAATVLSTALKK